MKSLSQWLPVRQKIADDSITTLTKRIRDKRLTASSAAKILREALREAEEKGAPSKNGGTFDRC